MDDKQIHNFLNLTEEFDGLIIDEDNMLLERSTLTQVFLQSQIDVPKEIPWDDITVLATGVVGNETKEDFGPEL